VPPPANDSFAGAPVLSGYSGATPGTLAGATLEEGEPSHGGQAAGSTWYKWRPRVDGPVSVDTRGSGGDTRLDVYTGTDLAGLTLVGANDDAVDLAPQSRVTFTAVEGTTYRIAVSGRGEPMATSLRWGPPPHGFADVLPGARVETAVGWAAATGVIPGFADGSWRPRSTVTRGQAVAALWRMLGSPAAGVGGGGVPSLPFTDVGPGAPYREALTWAVSSGVVPASSTFRPRDPLTRAELASWTWAALGRPAATPDPSLADVPTAAPYAVAAAWAHAHQLAPAFGDGTFRPSQAVTRSKLALGLFALAGDPTAWASVPGETPATVVF
jgi:hypothetical protein